jgi:peroxisomal 2,4-dienoyl-CoA reductase
MDVTWTGHVLVVDGAAWIYRPTFIPREMVSKVSRGVEGKSRATGVARQSKL